MAEDIYSNFSTIFIEKYTTKEHYTTLTIPYISLEGATRYTIPAEYEYRPDLISYITYGSIDFEEIIIFVNKITDPIKDFYAGRILYLPSFEEITRLVGV